METTKELKLLCYSSIASRRARNISGLTGLDGPIKGFNKGADTMRSRTPDKSLSSSNSSLETIYFMFARALEDILRRYSSKADFGREAVDAFEHRFRSLRGSGLLPSGRENRAQRLSTQQIAYAILSTASIQPGWAGATAVILANLVPEGGAETSFFNVGTLLDTITKLIEDDAARASLILLTLSAAEGGLNSSGFANLVYIDASGQRRHSRYMHRLAANFTSPNNEARNDLNRRYAKMSRELVLNTAFFDALAREIDRSQHWPAPPGEGEEYTIEEIEDHRRKALGVRSGARYLNIGVENHVAWPAEERLVKFDEYELVLMPRTPDHSASIHIDLHRYRLSQTQARTLINRFLSMMSWVDDHYAISQDGWSGNPIPVAVPRRELATITAHQWIFARRIPTSEQTRRALALYREARNAQQNFMVSYAVLNFYKIVELRHPGRAPARTWIRDNYLIARSTYAFDESFERLETICQGQTVHEYLYTACRVAVAHGSPKSSSDPDDADEIRRLHTAADVLRWMARHLIKTELQVGEHP